MRTKTSYYLLILLLVLLQSGISFGQNSRKSDKNTSATDEKADNYFEISKNLDIYISLFKEINTYYVDEINPSSLIQTSIRAMLKTLDPYTVFFSESEAEDVRFLTTGNYGGIGSSIGKKGDYVIITEPYEGFAAQKSGLIAGDAILEIDGKSAKGMNESQISTLLKGEPGTVVKLKIQRYGQDQPLEISITRDKIKIDNVPYYGMISDSIAYIILSGFKNDASVDVKNALLALQKDHVVKGLVLDLRGNPGGLLIEAVRLAGLFVPKGELIVNTKGKVESWNQEYKTYENPISTSLPLVVLANGSSASASEIVAGALQDIDRAVIIGEQTYGKGLVQTTRALSYNTQLKVTTSKYYIPSGRCIQKIDYSHKDVNGVAIKFADSLSQEFKTKNGRIVKDGKGIAPDILTKKEETPEIIRTLQSEYLIFDYACKYKIDHPAIAPAADFSLSDKEYEDFILFVKDKNISYKTNSEKALESFKQKAEKENYFEIFADDYNDILTKIENYKDKELSIYKEDIKKMIENEIVSRYYYQKGRIIADLHNDKDIKEAILVLDNNNKYSEILNPAKQ